MKIYIIKFNMFLCVCCMAATALCYGVLHAVTFFLLKSSDINLNTYQGQAGSIGVIGGPDGPTAVYVVGIVGPDRLFFLIIILGWALAALVSYNKYKKDKEQIREFSRLKLILPVICCAVAGITNLLFFSGQYALLFILYGLAYFISTRMKRFRIKD